MSEHPIFEKVKEMPEPWRSHFPKSTEEAQKWKPIIDKRGLSMCVLCVANTRIEGMWSAYCDAVPGDCHKLEYDAVLANGAKLPEAIARAIFPRFKDVPYAH